MRQSPVVTIRDLSITGGNGNGDGNVGTGGGVLALPEFNGNGAPQLTLDRVRVANNTASQTGNFNAVGGGALSDGLGTQVIVRDSLISGNQAVGTANAQATGGGVAAFAAGTLAIVNTTGKRLRFGRLRGRGSVAAIICGTRCCGTCGDDLPGQDRNDRRQPRGPTS